MMARRMIFIVACLCIATAAFGQRVSRTFNDVSMSEALKWLNERDGEYNISFLYYRQYYLNITIVASVAYYDFYALALITYFVAYSFIFLIAGLPINGSRSNRVKCLH